MPLGDCIKTELAFETSPQFNVEVCPGEMVNGLAMKLENCGVPLQPIGAGLVGGGFVAGGGGGGGGGAPGTVITASKRAPNGTPFDACSCQTLVYEPGAVGAVILIEILIVSPGFAAEMDCGELALNGLPSTNNALNPPSHEQVPEFWSAHVLTNEPPGAMVVPSGIVTSETNVEARVQVEGGAADVAEAGGTAVGTRRVAVGMTWVCTTSVAVGTDDAASALTVIDASPEASCAFVALTVRT